MSKSDLNIDEMKQYIKAGLNILIVGPPGTGKTFVVKKAVEELGLRMKYFSTPTLDPFTELIGVPVPNKESKIIEYYRPKHMDECEVIFWDEMNRADDRTLNTIFEINQFKTINGEPLPKLRSVVAAINPPTEEFSVTELDPALEDRFDIFLYSHPEIHSPYFNSKYGAKMATVAKEWWNEEYKSYLTALKNTENKSVYLSPRRLEKMLDNYVKVPTAKTLKRSLPLGSTADYNVLARRLEDLASGGSKDNGSQNDAIRRILSLDDSMLASTTNTEKINTVLSDEKVDEALKQKLLDRMAVVFNRHVDPNLIASNFMKIYTLMNEEQVKRISSNWSELKSNILNNAVTDYYNNEYNQEDQEV